jgi:ABC-type antimicrobial peptide transport system permease subunit
MRENKIVGNIINLVKSELDGTSYRALSDNQKKTVEIFKTILCIKSELTEEVEQKIMEIITNHNTFDFINKTIVMAKEYKPELDFLSKVQKALIDDFNNNKTNVEFYAKNLQVLSYINVNGKVIGYINNIGYLNAIIISDTAYQAISNKENAIFNVILKISLKSKENIKLFNYVLDNEMNFQSYYQNNFETLQQFISELSKVLSGINIFVTLLVIILFFSFIISSIKLNKKKIGVIRALGARQVDTFKIFAWEGAIISIFSLVVSFIILSIMIPIINTTASKSSLMYITYIVSTPKSVLSMILLTILITILSISLPLRRFSKLKPMDAITDK